ncbi:metallophosphoesterase [Caulobacter sp. NIBR1757]|uniref:metallophosphoesterase family protein n=1 Tax=Caulobacter sp. NIBR1757 TaxID=3016000 RepID=UPI0027A61447|nr:3',5'-cyclic adenosine monophosphate phosphodiesterase CpdA [Caulobacter sp. NIBR1757]
MSKLRLFHASDIHFGGENQAAVAGAAQWLADNPVDLAILSGDLTREGQPGEFEAARAWIDTLPCKVVVTAGNHDVPYFNIPYRALMPWKRFDRWMGDLKAPPPLEGLSYAGINTARGVQPRANWSKGQISMVQVRKAIGRIRGGQPGDLKLVTCHHPLVEVVGGPMTGNVWGGSTAAEAFTVAGADLVLTGHIHTPFVHAYPFGDQRTYAVGAGTLSIRERGVAPSFNSLEIEAECITVTAMAWQGTRYEPFRTWRVDRRLSESFSRLSGEGGREAVG